MGTAHATTRSKAEGRPDFLPKDLFRAYLKNAALNKYIRVGGILPTSYIAQCDRKLRPIKSKTISGTRFYRLLDIVARARAECLAITEPEDKVLTRDIKSLRAEKEWLEATIRDDKHRLALQEVSVAMTGKTLLTEAEIVAGRMKVPNVSGVYFLILEQQVVYVGQSTQVFKRIFEHLSTKTFDGFAYIPCEPEGLDALESLYIHTMRPVLNGKHSRGIGMHAPLRIDALIGSKGAAL